MIRCVIFDIDNTLYSYTKANAAAMQGLYAYAGEWLGLSAAEFDKLAAKASKGISDRLSLDNATVHNRLIRFQNILEDLGLPLYPHAVNARMKALWYNPDEKALPEDVEMDIRKKIGENIGTVCKCIGNYREVIDRLDDYLG